MTKEQTRWPYVSFVITSTLLTFFILFINNNHFQILLAQNNQSGTKDSISTTIMPTHAPTSSNPSNIIESFMSTKALLASTIDQIRNSTARNDNSNNETSAARNATIFVRNPGILVLSHQIIPPHDFIPVYYAMPYKIVNGQIFAKLP